MGAIAAFVDFVRNPAAVIAGWIAALGVWAYAPVFAVVFIETGLVFFPFLPGDSMLFACGVFANGGGFALPALLTCVWMAAILGDQCNFAIGHAVGSRLVTSGKVKALTPERIEKTEAMLEKYGSAGVFLGRFFPFIRTFVPFFAGMGGMRWRNFVVFNVLGAVAWSSLFVLLGYFFGGIPFVQNNFELVLVGIVAVSLIPAVGGVVGGLGKRRVDRKPRTDRAKASMRAE